MLRSNAGTNIGRTLQEGVLPNVRLVAEGQRAPAPATGDRGVARVAVSRVVLLLLLSVMHAMCHLHVSLAFLLDLNRPKRKPRNACLVFTSCFFVFRGQA